MNPYKKKEVKKFSPLTVFFLGPAIVNVKNVKIDDAENSIYENNFFLCKTFQNLSVVLKCTLHSDEIFIEIFSIFFQNWWKFFEFSSWFNSFRYLKFLLRIPQAFLLFCENFLFIEGKPMTCGDHTKTCFTRKAWLNPVAFLMRILFYGKLYNKYNVWFFFLFTFWFIINFHAELTTPTDKKTSWRGKNERGITRSLLLKLQYQF